MIEKFNDFESNFIEEEGTYRFKITDYELKDGNVAPMAMFTFKAEEGTMKRGFSLSDKARWRYNQLIAAALKLTKEQRRTYELDYETIGQELVGKEFYGVVEFKEVPRTGKIQLNENPEYLPQLPDSVLSNEKEGEETYFTETLAKIYIKQGRYSKALEIIRRLSLDYPKKNAYFADQIRFLEKLIINNKNK